jgi:prevent-host-death family protein
VVCTKAERRCLPLETARGAIVFTASLSENLYNLYELHGLRIMDLSISEARETLAEVINRVAYQGERVVLRRHGKAVAALVSAEDLRRLETLRAAKPSRSNRRRST